jgi:protein-disulfide isomerase
MKQWRLILVSAVMGITGSLGAEPMTTGAAAAPAPSVVVKVGNAVITAADMQSELGMRLYNIENQMYQTKKMWIDQKVKGLLFDQAAKDAKLSRADWEKREIDAVVTAPSEGDVQNFLKNVPPQQAAMPDMNKRIFDMLSQQKRSQRENELVRALQARTTVEILLSAPEAPKIDITYSPNDPVLGPANAPVTLMEFTDFQCPWCKRSQDSIHQVRKNYADKVKLVSRQFPLPMHNRAMPAAMAAVCAKAQGKFWEYHDKMFDGSPKLEDADLLNYAEQAGLKKSKFQKCLADPATKTQVEKDMADGQRYGVSGTPTFFLNGRLANFQDLENQVKAELAKTK